MAGLYIHVPFCRSKCFYCDFYSLPRLEQFGDRYVRALGQEWNLRKQEIEEISTIYFGGGTPSLLSENQIAEVKSWLPVSEGIKEFTIEVNPEDVTPQNINLWKYLGVNRVSIGIQSLNDEELRCVGRRHTARKALETLELVSTNFDNISVDVILGLRAQTLSSLQNTLRQICDFRPSHISAYILSVEKGTKLWSLKMMNRFKEQSDEVLAEMYTFVCDTLARSGYDHYEVSNFALPGRRAMHNSAYWKNEPYLGLGPGAHSFDGKARRYNPSSIKDWLEKIETGTTAYKTEEETLEEQINNLIMIRLRTAEGLNLETIPSEYAKLILSNVGQLPEGRVVFDDKILRIPEREWLVSDDTIARLFV